MSLLQCHHVRRHVPKKGDPFKSVKIMYLRALGAGIAGNRSEFWAYASLISGQIHRAMPQNFTLPVSYLIRTWSLPKPILTQCSLLKSSMFYPFLGQRLALLPRSLPAGYTVNPHKDSQFADHFPRLFHCFSISMWRFHRITCKAVYRCV